MTTDQPDTATIDAAFDILDWNEESYDEPETGPKLTRVTITKRYHGAIDGHGVAHVLTAQGEAGAGYVASERITGTLDGREGTFVIQHDGLSEGSDQATFGTVIAGSGTGKLAGLRGHATESQHGILTLQYSLPST